MKSKFNVTAVLAALVLTALVFAATSSGTGGFLEWVSSLTKNQQIVLRAVFLMAPALAVLGLIARRRSEHRQSKQPD